MSCYHPLTAYQSINERTPNGKALIRFQRNQVSNSPFQEIKLPCNQCIGCRIARSKTWALRSVHEASLYSCNCFITLTFNDEHLDPVGSLNKSDFTLFIKRLRKHHHGIDAVDHPKGGVHYPIRYFHCGEYGAKLTRPHHHAILFNFDFPDRKLWSCKMGIKLYRSKMLEELWTDGNGKSLGYSSIGEATFESAAYCARYITKKINGDKQEHHYINVDHETGECRPIIPEYITMSRRPGIGKRFFENNPGDFYPKDYITHKGRIFKTPSYYDAIYDSVDPVAMDNIKKERRSKAKSHHKNNTYERLLTREQINKAQLKKLFREYENDH